MLVGSHPFLPYHSHPASEPVKGCHQLSRRHQSRIQILLRIPLSTTLSQRACLELVLGWEGRFPSSFSRKSSS